MAKVVIWKSFEFPSWCQGRIVQEKFHDRVLAIHV